MSSVKPHLCRAEPKATVPLVGSTFHCFLCSFSPYNEIRLLKSRIIRRSLDCTWSVLSFSSLIRRSTLLMKRTGFTRSLRAWRVTVSVWTITSSTASTTTTAPSMALRARVTLPVKSTCPGVSMRLTTCDVPSISWRREMLAVLMVIPRFCSSSR